VSQLLGSHEEHQVELVRNAAHAIGKAFWNNHYAIIGGAACNLLGSTRATGDVDVVVPRGKTPEARSLLQAETELFHVEKRTRRTWFRSSPPVEIDILAPPGMFKEKFDPTTPTTTIDGTKILKPALLLNAKCKSILQRGGEKQYSDAMDILFLLTWCIEHDCIPIQEEVPNIGRDFVLWFIETSKKKIPDIAECWEKAGFNMEKGIFTV